MFCSETCQFKHDHQKSNHEVYQKSEYAELFSAEIIHNVRFFLELYDALGGRAGLENFYDDHHDKQYTVFDFDWSNPADPAYLKNMLLASVTHELNHEGEKEILHALKGFCEDKVFIEIAPDNKLKKIIKDDNHKLRWLLKLVFRRQTMKIGNLLNNRNPVGSLFHPTTHLMRRTCGNPNIVTHTDRKSLVWIALRPIKSGEILFDLHPHFFREGGCAECGPKRSCDTCVNDIPKINYTVPDFENLIGRNFADFGKLHDFRELTSWLEYLQHCIDFINSNFDISSMKKDVTAKQQEMASILGEIANPFPPSSHSRYARFCVRDEDDAKWTKSIYFPENDRRLTGMQYCYETILNRER